MYVLNPDMKISSPDPRAEPPKDPFFAIRQRFLTLAETYVLDIAMLRRAAESPAQLRESLTGIGLIAHRVSGVAATLGYDSLGQAAASLDRQLTQALLRGPLDLRTFDQPISIFHASLSNVLDVRQS